MGYISANKVGIISLQFVWRLLIFLQLLTSFTTSIDFKISTKPNDLGFEKYTNKSSETKSLFFIQPTKSGYIEAKLGGVESRHDYNMSSISAFLSTDTLKMQGNYIPKLFVLCAVDNAHLIAKKKSILLCNFEVTMPSYGTHTFSSTACLIHCAKEMECSAEIDLGFIRRQAEVSIMERSEIVISYNVTALDISSLGPHEPIIERDDVTNSLVYKQMKLPIVIIHHRPDMESVTLLSNGDGYPLLLLKTPGIVDSNIFDVYFLTLSPSSVSKLKLNLRFPSDLRFLWVKDVDPGWRLIAKSTPNGVTVRLRPRKPANEQEGMQRQLSNTAPSISLAPPGTPTDPVDTSVRIGFLRFERVLLEGHQTSRPLGTSVMTTTIGETMDDSDGFVSFDGEAESSMDSSLDTSSLDLDSIRVYISEWQPGVGVDNRTNPVGQVMQLPIPATFPDPNSMQIFVQFQPADVLEPPWSPSREPPPPRQLKVIGLVPSSTGVRSFPVSFRAAYGISGPQTAGRLIHLTNQVFCRATLGSISVTPLANRLQSSCPFQMPEAPVDLEVGFPVPSYSMASPDRILLALRQDPSGPGGSANQEPSSSEGWVWRAWYGPTVRRWQFENFRLRLGSTRLRRIANLPVFNNRSSNVGCTAGYEQTEIIVTARIYTSLPETAERMYLSESPSEAFVDPHDPDASVENEYAHLLCRPVELDVTHLLPTWSIRLKSLDAAQKTSYTVHQPPAIVIWSERDSRPILIGQRPGQVRLEVIAAHKDPQPLAHVDVVVTDKAVNNLVSFKAECVSWMITLSGKLEPHLSAENPSQMLPNEKEMTADLNIPHPRILNLAVRGRHPDDLQVVTSVIQSGVSPTGYPLNTAQTSCPLGKIALSLILADGSAINLHEIPRGLLRVRGPTVGGVEVVWDPGLPLELTPETEEGRTLVEAGKMGLGPLVDLSDISLWSGYPKCALRGPLFTMMQETISRVDPGPTRQSFDWEHAAIIKFRKLDNGRTTSPTQFSPFQPTVTSYHISPSMLMSSPIKFILFGLGSLLLIGLMSACIAVVVFRRRRSLLQQKARIEEDLRSDGDKCPSGAMVESTMCSKQCGQQLFQAPPQPPSVGSTQYQLSYGSPAGSHTNQGNLMNPGLSCSSVFSGGSGSSKPQQMPGYYGNQQMNSSMLQTGTSPMGQETSQMELMQWMNSAVGNGDPSASAGVVGSPCSGCHSVGIRSPNSNAVPSAHLGSCIPSHLRYQSSILNMPPTPPPPLQGIPSSSSGYMRKFSNQQPTMKWPPLGPQNPESGGGDSGPSSRQTGSPSTNDEGFASGPLDLPSLGHLYKETWEPPSSSLLQPLPSCPCNMNFPSTSQRTTASDIERANSFSQHNNFFPPALQLSHDPETIGSNRYAPNFPPAMLLSPPSHYHSEGFMGESGCEGGKMIDTAALLMDSGRESQDKTSSSASSNFAPQFDNLPPPDLTSSIEITTVDV